MIHHENIALTETVEQEISDEKARHEELNAQIREWEKKMKTQHKGMGGVNMSRGHIVRTQKNISKLENQLSQVCINIRPL